LLKKIFIFLIFNLFFYTLIYHYEFRLVRVCHVHVGVLSGGTGILYLIKNNSVIRSNLELNEHALTLGLTSTWKVYNAGVSVSISNDY